MSVNTSFSKMVITSVMFLFASSNVQSAFIDNGLTTTDTLTHLEWLDLTVTENFSYNQIETALLSGGVLDGFRRATGAEISNMFANFGLVSGPANATHYDFMDLFGVTNFQGDQPQSFGYADSSGSSMALVYGLDYIGAGNYLVYTGGLKHNKTINFDGFGSFLVRAVPIPAGIWLFISGLLGFIGISRKRQARR